MIDIEILLLILLDSKLIYTIYLVLLLADDIKVIANIIASLVLLLLHLILIDILLPITDTNNLVYNLINLLILLIIYSILKFRSLLILLIQAFKVLIVIE